MIGVILADFAVGVLGGVLSSALVLIARNRTRRRQ